MTPEEFAEAHGLSVEEATYILSRRKALAEPSSARVERARSILASVQKRVGVHPVVVQGEEAVSVHDPDAEEGLGRFYKRKDIRMDDCEKSDPGDSWDEFDQSGGDR